MASVTLYVGNLDTSVTNKVLCKHFDDNAPDFYVDYCVIVKDSQTNQSLGFGFVKYCNYDEAAEAMKLLDSIMLMNRPIQVLLSPFHHSFSPSVIFIKNLDNSVDKTVLFNLLKVYGNIIFINLATDASGYAAVRYDCVEAAETAITALNGLLGISPKGISLALRIRDKSEDYLRDTFSPYGEVTSVSIVEKGQRYGRVAFKNSKVADKAARERHPHLAYLGRVIEKKSTFRALGEMDAKMIVTKQLHHNLFEGKEEDEQQQKTERSQAPAQFSQGHPVAVTSPGGALPVYTPLPLPIYPPPAMYPLQGPGFGQQVPHPQALPTLFPLQNS